jgi:hypothetical protein
MKNKTVASTDAIDTDDHMNSPMGVHTSGGNKNDHRSVESIQLFLTKKTMDSILPSLTSFSRTASQQTVTVPPTSGQEVNRFSWLVYRPQAHAVKPFTSDQSVRQEKYVNTTPNNVR